MNLILSNDTDARTARAGAAALMAFAASLEGGSGEGSDHIVVTVRNGEPSDAQVHTGEADRGQLLNSEYTLQAVNGKIAGIKVPTATDSVAPAAFVPGDAGAAASPIAPAASQDGAATTTTSAPTAPAAPSTAASAPAAQPSPAGAVDATGLPWDARIHSSPPKTREDGKWRKKRNLDDAVFIASVEAELRGATPATLSAPPPPPVAAAAPNVQPVAPAAPPPPVAGVDSSTTAAPSTASAPAIPAPPPPVPTAPATAQPATPSASSAAPAPAGFEQFMAWLGEKMSNGMPFTAVNDAIGQSGFTGGLPDLNAPANLPYLMTVWTILRNAHGE